MLDVPQTLSPCGVLMKTGIEGCSDVCAVVTVNAGITYLVSARRSGRARPFTVCS